MSDNRARPPIHRQPGYNVDHVDVEAGMRALVDSRYTHKKNPNTFMVVNYALLCHARGDEDIARKVATDASLHGVELTVWYRVLASAIAAGNAKNSAISAGDAKDSPTSSVQPSEKS